MSAKIYESPDGGQTVYERSIGSSPSTKRLVSDKKRNNPTNDYDPIWGEVTGFPDWTLLRKYPELREAYENFLRVQEEYKVLEILSSESEE